MILSSDPIQGAVRPSIGFSPFLRKSSLDCHYSDAGSVPASFSSRTKGKFEPMNQEKTLAKGLRKLAEDEREILIEEASEVRTFRNRGRGNFLLHRYDDLPQFVGDEA